MSYISVMMSFAHTSRFDMQTYKVGMYIAPVRENAILQMSFNFRVGCSNFSADLVKDAFRVMDLDSQFDAPFFCDPPWSCFGPWIAA